MNVNGAPSSEIADIIDKCPSGDLQYELLKNQIKIVFEADQNSSIAYDGDVNIGECHFARFAQQWVITLTDVDKNYAGQGIGKKLVENIIEQARIEKIQLVPSCPFARKFFESHPEYQDVL